MGSDSSADPDSGLDRILQWAQEPEQGIKINAKLVPRRFEGRGLGLAVEQVVQPNSNLVEVPIDTIICLTSIPKDFIARFENTTRTGLDEDVDQPSMVSESSTSTGKTFPKPENVTTHALIASYLAFHHSSPLALTINDGEPHPWPETWPSLLDFWTSMPMLWGRVATHQYCSTCHTFVDQGSTACGHKDQPVDLLPPLVGKMVKKQTEKFDKDWKTVIQSGVVEGWQETGGNARRRQDSKAWAPLDPLLRFTYCWLIVNTRCFYFTPPMAVEADGPKTRSTPPFKLSAAFPDPNDNMALVPFLDLFNHVSSPPTAGIAGRSSKSIPIPCEAGYTVSAYTFTSPSKPLPMSQEVYTSYGSHPQDFLFPEYGFILPIHSNNDDILQLDSMALPGVSTEHISLLEEQGFLADYSLYPINPALGRKEAEICFRTQVLAVLTAETNLERANSTDATGTNSKGNSPPTSAQESEEDPAWIRFLLGFLDLDDPSSTELREEANNVINGWIKAYRDRAQQALFALDQIKPAKGKKNHLDLLSDALNESILPPSTSSSSADREKQLQPARLQRHSMLQNRWTEINEICEQAGKRMDWF